MKNNLFLSIIFLLIIQAFVARGQNPEYDATYLSVNIECILNTDHSMEYRYAKVQKLNTYRAFHSLYGETFVTYNPGYQKLKINEAFTIMADGRKVITPGNAFNEVLPRFAANAPEFNSLREMVITHTGLEKGATIHLDYSILSEKDFEPFFTGDELLADVEPIKEMIIKVKIPAGTQFSYRLTNIKGKPTVANAGGYTTYTWKFNDLPVISAEEFQAGGNVLYPHLQFSTSKTYPELCAKLSNQDAFRYILDNRMKADIENLAKETSDKLLLALKLQEKVINEFNLVSTPMVFTGYRLLTPEQVWTGNYGRGTEKALLLTALLRHSGIPAQPVAVSRTAALDMNVPVIQAIEDVMVEANLPGEQPLYLSVTSMQLPYLNGKSIISLDPATAGEIMQIPDVKSSASSKYVFFISTDLKLTGTGSLALENGFNPYLAIKRDQSKIKNYLSGGIKQSDIKEIKQSEISPGRTSFECSFQKDKPLRKDTSYWFFTLPSLTNGVDNWGMKTLPSDRKTPLYLPAAGTESFDMTLTLPEGLDLFTPEGRTEIKNSAGTYIFEISKEAGKVIIHKEISVNEQRIEVKGYAAFKALMDNWNLQASREIMLVGK